MTESVLLDNDVILKVCAYRRHAEILAITSISDIPPAILGIARFTLRSRLTDKSGLTDPDGAMAALQELLDKIILVEPSMEEIELASELEEMATAKSYEFDTGESQLVAVLIRRGAPLLVTGDKRAIVAINGIGVAEAEERIACLEQLIAEMLNMVPHSDIRRNVCAEPTADKALTACFACSADAVEADDILIGLNSYIGHLRKGSGSTLVSDFRAVVS